MRSSLRSSSRTVEGSYWPGFVDAMAQLLLVVVFLLSVFVIAQFYTARDVLNRDALLGQLRAQVEKLSDLLSLEKSEKADLSRKISILEESAHSSSQGDMASALDLEKEKVDLLNQQISSLRRQLSFVQSALGRVEANKTQTQEQVDNFGRRLNIALAQKVKELEAYRSEFFGRLREVLSKRSDIRILGDRFVFQSEILFAQGSGDLREEGKVQLIALSQALKDLQTQIPDDIDWILEVGGHTDKDPIQTSDFQSNWELSTKRALSVVHFLLKNGVPARRLFAAGFGEFQPVEQGDTPQEKAKNRRIEFKLTQR